MARNPIFSMALQSRLKFDVEAAPPAALDRAARPDRGQRRERSGATLVAPGAAAVDPGAAHSGQPGAHRLGSPGGGDESSARESRSQVDAGHGWSRPGFTRLRGP